MKSQITYPPNDPRAASWPAAAKSSCPHCRQTLVMRTVEAGLRLQCFACRGELYVSRDLSQLVPLGQQPPASGAASPAPPKGWDLFICHASEQAAIAQGLVQELEQAGLSCWVAPRNIRKGSIYAEEIMLGLRQSQIVLVLHSPAADASPFVLREINEGVSLGKELLTVRIGDFQPCKSIAFYLSTAVQLTAEFAHGRLQAGPIIAHAQKQLSRSRELTRVIPTAQAAQSPSASLPGFRFQAKPAAQLPPAQSVVNPLMLRVAIMLGAILIVATGVLALFWQSDDGGRQADTAKATPLTIISTQESEKLRQEREAKEQQRKVSEARKRAEERQLEIMREPVPKPINVSASVSQAASIAAPAKKDSSAYAESLGKSAKVAGYDGIIRFFDIYKLLQLNSPPSSPETAVPLGNPELAFDKPQSVALKAEHLIQFGPVLEIQKAPQSPKWALHLKGDKAPPSAIASLELRGGQFYFWWSPEFLAWRDLEPINNGAIVRWSLYNHLVTIDFDGDRSLSYQFLPPAQLRVAIPGNQSSDAVLSFREVTASTTVLADSPTPEDERWLEYARPFLEFDPATLKPTKPGSWPNEFDWEKKGNVPHMQLKSHGLLVAAQRFDLQCFADTLKINFAPVNFAMLELALKSRESPPPKPKAAGKTDEERKLNEERTAFQINLKKWEEKVNNWKSEHKELPRLQAIIDHASELKYPLRLVAKPKAGLNRTIVVAGFRPE